MATEKHTAGKATTEANPGGHAEDCPLCREDGGVVLWRDRFCRVVAVDDPDYPGYCRVILQRHEREMTDLAPDEQHHLMLVVFEVEAALRDALMPDKVNLASLGNAVPHVHWHVVPRFRDDRHYPAPIWAAPARGRTQPRAFDAGALGRRLAERLTPG
jgi:diadenosine tetraphosphate (Ap4A) HIT family hydrolase